MTKVDRLLICIVLLGLTLLSAIAHSRLMVLEAKHRLVEVDLTNTEIENRFLARKLGELHYETDVRFTKQECQTDLAVAGFRMGHVRARRMMREGVFEACNITMERDIERRQRTITQATD